MNIVYRGILECEDIMLVLAFKKACDIKKCQAIDENLYYLEIDTDSKVYQENKSWALMLEFYEYFQEWSERNPHFFKFDEDVKRKMTWTGLDNFGAYNHTSYPEEKGDEWTWRGGKRPYKFYSIYTSKIAVSTYRFWEELADGIDE